MSNQSAVVVSKPVYMAAAQRKLFNAANFPSIVAGKLPYAETEAARPSMVKMDKASAAAAMGGKASPVSFANGLLFVAAAYANGQYGKDIDAIVKGLPDVSAFAIRRACGLLACGKGVTVGGLKAATLAALSDVLALGSKPKQDTAAAPKAAATLAAPVADEKTATPVTDNRAAAVWQKAENDHNALWAAYGDTLAAGFKAAAEKAAAPDFVGLFKTLAANNPTQAAAMLADMAAALGLVVVNPAQAATQAAATQAAEKAAAPAKKSRAKKAAA